MNYCILNQEQPKLITLGCVLHMATGNQCACCKQYQAGITKPAYPVPAIQYDAMINPLGVEIAEIKGLWNDYSQCCKSVWLHMYR